MKYDIKLVASDFDGTIAIYPTPSSWELIDRELGCVEEDKNLNHAYHRGEFDIATWSRKTANLYAKHGLTYEKFREIFSTYAKPPSGLEKLFSGLHSKGIKTAIVSGTIRNAYDIFVEKYGLMVDYVRIAHEFYFDKDGKLSGGNFTNFDYKGKIEALQEICDQLGITLEQCAFVGDSANDIPVFRKVALPVAINSSDQEVRNAAKIIIGEDISQILKYI